MKYVQHILTFFLVLVGLSSCNKPGSSHIGDIDKRVEELEERKRDLFASWDQRVAALESISGEARQSEMVSCYTDAIKIFLEKQVPLIAKDKRRRESLKTLLNILAALPDLTKCIVANAILTFPIASEYFDENGRADKEKFMSRFQKIAEEVLDKNMLQECSAGDWEEAVRKYTTDGDHLATLSSLFPLLTKEKKKEDKKNIISNPGEANFLLSVLFTSDALDNIVELIDIIIQIEELKS
mmetsp:Transcript_4364/g.9883  ORF Transcript_4364/g.9883 Transcript_4364/m.9883 type:complete len:240 (+) Transcript_4364:3959-4678(+)